jgi:hypothetical protein
MGRQCAFLPQTTKSSKPSLLLYSEPGFNRSRLLVEGIECQDARFSVGANASRVNPNYCIFLSAEPAEASLVDRDRHRLHGVADVDPARH